MKGTAPHQFLKTVEGSDGGSGGGGGPIATGGPVLSTGMCVFESGLIL